MTIRVVVLAAMLAVVGARGAVSQPPTQATQAQGGAGGGGGRARLEANIRQMFARAVRQRVGLNEEQMQRLAPITARYEQQRRELQGNERDARQSLRAMLNGTRPVDDAKVDAQLRRLLDVQKRRVEILESEQRDLATVMTPVQRARYMALQEQVRRRVEQMRQRRSQMLEGELDAAPGPRPRPRPSRP